MVGRHVISSREEKSKFNYFKAFIDDFFFLVIHAPFPEITRNVNNIIYSEQ